MDAQELIEGYRAGRRVFRGVDLRRVNLRRANLRHVNLSGADLSGADLSGAALSYANLSDANLSDAKLRRAKLHYAKLSGATLQRAKLSGAMLCGAKVYVAALGGADLRGADLYAADLRGSNLNGSNLHRATLSGAKLYRVDLSGADLSNALLVGVDLSGADLRGTDLRHTDLTSANLHHSDMSRADLSDADLNDADLNGATIRGSKFGSARLGSTHLTDIDAFEISEAEPPVEHSRPSAVDHRTILRSLRAPNLRRFLQQCGMPEVYIEYGISCAQSIQGSALHKMLRSTFISYGAPDTDFARQLYEALHRNGVTTFFFAEHAVPGEKLHRMMRKGVNEHDRIVLVCSRDSLTRGGVLNEIEEALAREARDGGEAYLIPIRLDRYVFDEWAPKNPDVAQAVRDRVVADFEGADADPAKFDAALLRLIGALKV